MTIIISVETSSELASAALLRDNQVLMRETSGVHMHSQTILPMVQSLLAQAGITLAECDAVAFGAGPGSFTGVRTACGIAQGLAFGLDLPVVPIVTLEAMAEACRATTGATDVLAVLDARMGEVYWAQYRFLDQWQVVVEPVLSAPAEVSPSGVVVACGNGLAAYAADFQGKPLIEISHSTLMPHATHVAQLARLALMQGRNVAARDAQPIYLRNKVALTINERLTRINA